MADQIVSWGGIESKGISGLGVTGSLSIFSGSIAVTGPNSMSFNYTADDTSPTFIKMTNGGGGINTGGTIAFPYGSIIGNFGGITLTNSGGSSYYLKLGSSGDLNWTGANLNFQTSGNTSIGSSGISGTSMTFKSGGSFVFNSFSGGFRDIIKFSQAGNLQVGGFTDAARLEVKGSGTTSSTTALLVQNANASASLQVRDDGTTTIASNTNRGYNLDVNGTGIINDCYFGDSLGPRIRASGGSGLISCVYSTLTLSGNNSVGINNNTFNVGTGGSTNGQLTITTPAKVANTSETVNISVGNMYYGVGEGRFVIQAQGNAGGYNALGNMYIAGGRNTNGGAHGNVYLGVDLTSPLGNVSVGTTSSLNYKFNVSGSGNFTNNLTVTGSVLNQPLTLPTASGTASMDCSQSNFFNLTLSGSYTLFLSASNIQPGQTVNLRVTQPATSGSLNYGSQFKFAGGIPYSASATGSAVDIISFISFDTTTLYGSAIKNLS